MGKTPEAVCLYIFNIVWMLVGIGGIALGIMSIVGVDFLWDTAGRQAPHMIGLGLFTSFISLIGIMSARQDKPTLKVLVYFNVCVFILIIVVILIVLYFAMS